MSAPVTTQVHSVVDAVVAHRRLRPRAHAFHYRVAYLCLGLDGLERAAGRWLKLDRPGLVAFHRADHGTRHVGGDLGQWLRGVLAEHGLAGVCDGTMELMTLPRMLGYVFNPVSFWFCHDRAGALRAVLAEVSNTFGERHLYLVAHPDRRAIAPTDWLQADKMFHVSPFLPVQGFYRFRFRLEADRVRADIHYHDAPTGEERAPMLVTYVDGERHDLSSGPVLRALLRHPAMTLAVIGLIHYQAIKIWLKKARFYRKPDPPQQPLSR